jgi:hypothetical protein
MKMHEYKTVNPYFEAAWEGEKQFENRVDDRPEMPKVGDYLWLREYNECGFPCGFSVTKLREGGKPDPYSGRSIIAKVTYILDSHASLAPKYFSMGFQVIERREHDSC